MALERNIYELDIDRLQEVLDYDPETGEFKWLVKLSPRGLVGKRAGCLTKGGYRRIAIDRRTYFASHLAWLYFYGVEPDEGMVVDFKNGERDDTRIANLRLATYSQNSQNIGRRANNSVGFKGVAVFNSDRNRKHYRSTITINKKRIHLGQFSTPEEAYAAYCAKAKELHGEFARVE